MAKKNSLRITLYIFIGLVVAMALSVYYCTVTTEADRTPKEPQEKQEPAPPGTVPD